MDKLRLETGAGWLSMVSSLVCVGVGIYDFQGRRSIWVVWALMFVLLLVNGWAMVKHLRPLAAVHGDRTPRTPSPQAKI